MPKKAKRAKTSKKNPKANPLPRGFGTVTPHLVINGAAQALDFYKKAFNAKEVRRQPMPDGKIMHAEMRIGDSILMLADEFPGSDMKAPTSIGTTTTVLHIYSNNVDKLWQQATAAGAKVAMPLDNQFWGERYGQLLDPYGHRWSVSMRVKMSPKEMEEKQKQAMAMFSQGEHPGRTEETTVTASN